MLGSLRERLRRRSIGLSDRFVSSWMRLRHRASIDGPPIWVVGCLHSGTSILTALLDSHSRLHAIPYESGVAARDAVDPRRFRRAIGAFERAAVAAGKRRWVEKTPRHIDSIGGILDACPDSQIVLVLRDGRDVAASIARRFGDIERGIGLWIERNEAGRAWWGHPQVHVLRYEDLVSDLDRTMRELMAFLGETYEAGQREHHRRKRRWYHRSIAAPASTAGRANHGQHRTWQINQPIFDGRGRWRELDPEDLATVLRVGGDKLREYGYLEPETA